MTQYSELLATQYYELLDDIHVLIFRTSDGKTHHIKEIAPILWRLRVDTIYALDRLSKHMDRTYITLINKYSTDDISHISQLDFRVLYLFINTYQFTVTVGDA